MHNRQFTIYKIGLTALFIVHCSLFIGASHVFANQTEYQLLTPIPLEKSKCVGNETINPDGTGGCKTNASAYIEGFFVLIIMVAGGLAVLRIIFGGIQYMSTDAFSGKSEAKTIIEHAVWGLLLAISAWLILNTVNPNLTKFNLNITPIAPTTPAGGGGTGGGTTSGGGLQQSTVNALAGLRQACSNCSIRITSTTGDSHDPNSLHYQGLAVDIGIDSNLTNFLTGQTTNPQACSTYLKTLNGVSANFLWEPKGSTCGGAVPSTGDHWHMSVSN